MSLVVKSNLKEVAKIDGKSLNISGDFAEALDKKVETLVREACRRATDNSRSTVMAKDL